MSRVNSLLLLLQFHSQLANLILGQNNRLTEPLAGNSSNNKAVFEKSVGNIEKM